MNKLRLLLFFIASYCNLNAQWLGPINNTLNTTNNILLNSTLVQGTQGSGNIQPLFLIQSNQPQGLEELLKVNYNGTEFGLPITLRHNYYQRNANGGLVSQMLTYGNFTVFTDGATTNNRGIFLKSPTNDILSVTQNELNYKGNAIIKVGDLMIKDASGDIQFRAYNDGLVIAREVKVNLNVIPPDYVFAEKYRLMPIKDLENYIVEHKHLPNIPSAKDFEAEGKVSLSELQFKLLEKVEELTLYVIQLNKENEELKRKLCALENSK